MIFYFLDVGVRNGRCAMVQGVKIGVVGHEENVVGVHVGLAILRSLR